MCSLDHRRRPVLHTRLAVVDEFNTMIAAGPHLTVAGEVIEVGPQHLTLAQPVAAGATRFEPLRVTVADDVLHIPTPLGPSRGIDGSADLTPLIGTQVTVTGRPTMSFLRGIVIATTITRIGDIGCLTAWRRQQAAAIGVPVHRASRSAADTVVAGLRAQGTVTRTAWVGKADLAAYHDATRGDERITRTMTTLGARLSGARAVDDIVQAISRVDAMETGLLVLSRGGGEVTDLALFDDRRILEAVRVCPVPVIAAIGHQRDAPLVEHVCDWVMDTPGELHRVLVKLATNTKTRGERREVDYQRSVNARAADQSHIAVLTETHRQVQQQLDEAKEELREQRRITGTLRQQLQKAHQSALAAAQETARARSVTTDTYRRYAVQRITRHYRTAAIVVAAVAFALASMLPHLDGASSTGLAVGCAVAGVALWRAPRALGRTDRRGRGSVPDIDRGYHHARTVSAFNRVDALHRGYGPRPTLRQSLGRARPRRRSGAPVPTT